MLSSFLIALREGVEAALVIGIVLVYLDRTGRSRLARFVWSGVALAVVLSLAAAVALERLLVNQEAFEGVLLLVAAVFVVSMVVWMNRVARHLRKHIEYRVDRLAQGTHLAAGLGLGAFVCLMVVREGAELALILRAVELSTEGARVWIGTGLGLAAAVAVGLFFFQGTLKVPIGRFFAATSLILTVIAVQLAITGVHELSEAMWLPSSQREMALVGPIVRNDVFFFIVILGTAALWVLRERLLMSRQGAADSAVANDAERRLLAWERRRQTRWMFAAGFACVAVVLALTADFIYARVSAAPPEARMVSVQGETVRIPIAKVNDGNLHLFRAEVEGTFLRFMVIRKPNGWGTALDACMICGWLGYRQDGPNVTCRNCAAAIYIPSIGEAGGCNPVSVPSRVEGRELVMDLSALAEAAHQGPH